MIKKLKIINVKSMNYVPQRHIYLRLRRLRAIFWSISWLDNIFTITSKEAVGDIVAWCDKFSIFNVTKLQLTFQCKPYLIQIRNRWWRHYIATNWSNVSDLVTCKPVDHFENCMLQTWFCSLKSNFRYENA